MNVGFYNRVRGGAEHPLMIVFVSMQSDLKLVGRERSIYGDIVSLLQVTMDPLYNKKYDR